VNENCLFTGVWYGPGKPEKPEMSALPLTKELKNLQVNINFRIHHKYATTITNFQSFSAVLYI